VPGIDYSPTSLSLSHGRSHCEDVVLEAFSTRLSANIELIGHFGVGRNCMLPRSCGGVHVWVWVCGKLDKVVSECFRTSLLLKILVPFCLSRGT